MKKLHLDLNQYANDKDGIEAFFDDFFLLSQPRLLEAVYQAQGFKHYYTHMEDHTRQMVHLYERLMTLEHIWKDLVKTETYLAEVPYKRFFMEEIIKGISAIDSKAIIK